MTGVERVVSGVIENQNSFQPERRTLESFPGSRPQPSTPRPNINMQELSRLHSVAKEEYTKFLKLEFRTPQQEADFQERKLRLRKAEDALDLAKSIHEKAHNNYESNFSH